VTRRCARCLRRRPLTQIPSALGLNLGGICEGCKRESERLNAMTARVLDQINAVRRPKPTLPIYERHHPQAHRIADRLKRDRALLDLRTRRLVKDVCDVFHVKPCTARIAVALARKAGGLHEHFQ
jgi:hypothetical protein